VIAAEPIPRMFDAEQFLNVLTVLAGIAMVAFVFYMLLRREFAEMRSLSLRERFLTGTTYRGRRLKVRWMDVSRAKFKSGRITVWARGMTLRISAAIFPEFDRVSAELRRHCGRHGVEITGEPFSFGSNEGHG
jgi:hypothetical protein